MGRKYTVPYALYRAHGFISPFLAQDTGFSQADLDSSCSRWQHLFDHDRSASRGEMGVRGLYVFEHSSALGNAPAHKLFDLFGCRSGYAPLLRRLPGHRSLRGRPAAWSQSAAVGLSAMFSEDDLLPLSGVQHLVFCERQWALIHIEQIWSENRLTAEGRELHERTHEAGSETRPGLRIARGLRLRSLRLGLSGQADVVEFPRRPSVRRCREKPACGSRSRWSTNAAGLNGSLRPGPVVRAGLVPRRDVRVFGHRRRPVLRHSRRRQDVAFRQFCGPKPRSLQQGCRSSIAPATRPARRSPGAKNVAAGFLHAQNARWLAGRGTLPRARARGGWRVT